MESLPLNQLEDQFQDSKDKWESIRDAHYAWSHDLLPSKPLKFTVGNQKVMGSIPDGWYFFYILKVVGSNLEVGNFFTLKSFSESSKSWDNALDIITLFHWNKSRMIFFVDPDEDIFLFVMEDTLRLIHVLLNDS